MDQTGFSQILLSETQINLPALQHSPRLHDPGICVQRSVAFSIIWKLYNYLRVNSICAKFNVVFRSLSKPSHTWAQAICEAEFA